MLLVKFCSTVHMICLYFKFLFVFDDKFVKIILFNELPQERIEVSVTNIHKVLSNKDHNLWLRKKFVVEKKK